MVTITLKKSKARTGTLEEASCPACLANVTDMAGEVPTDVTGWCPHTSHGYMVSLHPDRDPLLLQSAPMTEAESDAMRDRITDALRPRRAATLNA